MQMRVKLCEQNVDIFYEYHNTKFNWLEINYLYIVVTIVLSLTIIINYGICLYKLKCLIFRKNWRNKQEKISDVLVYLTVQFANTVGEVPFIKI